MERLILLIFACLIIAGCIQKNDGDDQQASYQDKIRLADFQLTIPEGWLEMATQYMIEFSLKDNESYRVIGYHKHDEDFDSVIAEWEGLFQEVAQKRQVELLFPELKLLHITGTFQRQVYPRAERRFPIKKYGVLLALMPSSHGPYYLVLEAPDDILQNQVQNFTTLLNSYQKTGEEAPALSEVFDLSQNLSQHQETDSQHGHGTNEHTHVHMQDEGTVAYADFVLKIPASWRKQPPTSNMRLVEIEVDQNPEHRVIGYYFGSVDLSKEEAVKQNFDRWAGQFLSLESREDIALKTDDLALVKMTGKYQNTMNPNAQQQDDYGMLGAVVHSKDGPYYFRLVAPKEIIEREQQDFVEFLNSYQKGSVQNTATTDSKIVSYANFEMHVPEGWSQQKSSSSMRLVEFTFNNPDYAIVGYYFGNQNMNQQQTVDSNLARWRGQFQKLEKEETISLEHKDLFLVQLTGVYIKKARPMDPQGVPTPGFSFLAAIVSSSEGPYYFRLEAPLEVVEEQKQNFINFLNSYTTK